MLEPESGAVGGLADAQPGHVALAHVEDAHGVVDERMDVALEDGLEVLLHLSARDLRVDPKREGAALLDGVDIGADELDLPVLDLVHIPHPEVLERGAVLPAHLYVHVRLADRLALEGRRNRDRNVDVGDLDLHAADLDGGRDDLAVVELTYELLVGADARGPDLGDLRVTDHREAHVDGARAGGELQIVNGAQTHAEREDAVPAVGETPLPVALLVAAEGQRPANGPVEGVDDRLGVRPERNDVDVPVSGRVLGDDVRL